MGDLCVQERGVQHISSWLTRLIGHAHAVRDDERGVTASPLPRPGKGKGVGKAKGKAKGSTLDTRHTEISDNQQLRKEVEGDREKNVSCQWLTLIFLLIY